MNLKFSFLFFLSELSVMVCLSACNNSVNPYSDQTAVAESELEINAPLPRDEISETLSLAESPKYFPGNETIAVAVRVVNTGKLSLVSAGKYPIRMGFSLVGPYGIDKPPGKRDFIRAPVALLEPNAAEVVQAILPVKDLLGLTIRVDLVQEGVAWLAWYGNPTLDVGPILRCDSQSKSLCDKSGAALRNGVVPALFSYHAKNEK